GGRDQVRKRSNPRIVAILYEDPGRSLSENQVFLTGPSAAAKPAPRGVFRTEYQQGWMLSIQIKCQISDLLCGRALRDRWSVLCNTQVFLSHEACVCGEI